MTCSPFDLSPDATEGSGDFDESDSEPLYDLRETMRGAAACETAVGIGAAVASSKKTSEATESRASDGVIDCMV